MGSESLGITSPPLQGASPAQHTQPSFSVSLTLPSGTPQGHKLCPIHTPQPRLNWLKSKLQPMEVIFNLGPSRGWLQRRLGEVSP